MPVVPEFTSTYFENYLILLQTKGRIKLLKSSFNKNGVSEAFLSGSSDFRTDCLAFSLRFTISLASYNFLSSGIF